MFEQFATVLRATGTVAEWARVEAAATARRLAAMVVLLDQAYAADRSADREQWYLDNWGAVSAEIGAEQNITQGAASHQLLIATALRDRLPHVAALFADGLVSYRVVSAITTRTALVRDPAAQRAVDKAFADVLTEWAPLSEDKLNNAIDAIVAEHDPHGVYRTKLSGKGRNVQFDYDGSGMATMFGTLFATHGKAVEKRLNVLARTVCPGDPRTIDQRRADSIHSVLHGLDYLPCLCGSDDCPGPTTAPKGDAVVYVVVNEDTLDAESDAAKAQDAALDGEPEPLFDKPLAEITTWDELGDNTVGGTDEADEAEGSSGDGEAAAEPEGEEPAADHDAGTDHEADDASRSSGTNAQTAASTNRGSPATRPGAILGGPFLAGALARRFARTAKTCKVCHPGDSPPEPRYTPSRSLAEFVRCRDLTCRFPGCSQPATETDIDHTIAWPIGPTCASNLKCLCRRHHLLKTFWGGSTGWRDRQLPDGTMIWTSPHGRTYVTEPGSKLLFPSLCAPTAPVTITTEQAEQERAQHNPGLTMPRRQRTRAQGRAQRIADDRRLNEEEALIPRDSAHDPWRTSRSP
ncbi:HNH endonuclease signature motif containing protein [Mycolicibacterium lacusdiani]|uniref:HNH endonuclease signature motif containing protein n=1 Tax=Mycolicibacterium lacusdiani TaxID=2895283 RepID=UPI001F48DA88|nr:HNH endonuclease signature motif containing protein [Mycolicibacterium lacusdiani]